MSYSQRCSILWSRDAADGNRKLSMNNQIVQQVVSRAIETLRGHEAGKKTALNEERIQYLDSRLGRTVFYRERLQAETMPIEGHSLAKLTSLELDIVIEFMEDQALLVTLRPPPRCHRLSYGNFVETMRTEGTKEEAGDGLYVRGRSDHSGKAHSRGSSQFKSRDGTGKLMCFICHSDGHLKRDCLKKKSSGFVKKGTGKVKTQLHDGSSFLLEDVRWVESSDQRMSGYDDRDQEKELCLYFRSKIDGLLVIRRTYIVCPGVETGVHGVHDEKRPPSNEDAAQVLNGRLGASNLREKQHGLFDLGASVSQFPYSMFSRQGLGEPKPTRMCVELVDSFDLVDDPIFKYAKEELPKEHLDSFLCRDLEWELDQEYEVLQVDSLKRTLKDLSEDLEYAFLKVCIDYRKLNDATRKDYFPLPFIDQMTERLSGKEYYFFSDGFLGYFQIPINPKDQEKTTFTCPYGIFSYRKMSFGFCNAPGTFLEVYDYDFSRHVGEVYGEMKVLNEDEIDDNFPDEHLIMVNTKEDRTEPWYTNIVNFLLNELGKLRDNEYENSRIYKEPTKKWHDARLSEEKDFKLDNGLTFELNENRLKKYYHGIHMDESKEDVHFAASIM
ncbi:reverse transcriptase domain-containing protein [Tanacetum coccineum]